MHQTPLFFYQRSSVSDLAVTLTDTQYIIGLLAMKIIRTLFTVAIFSANVVNAQTANSPAPQLQGESDMIDLIDGCHPKAKPNCQARIICTGSSAINGKNSRDVQTAMKVASTKANSELAKYLGNKLKMTEDIKELEKTYSKENSQGSQTQQEFGQLVSYVNSVSTEQFLQGVAVLGGKVDMGAGKVSVVIGQSCDTVNAAQSLTQRMQQGNNQSSSEATGSNQSASSGSQNDGGVGGPNINVGTPRSATQKPSNDF